MAAVAPMAPAGIPAAHPTGVRRSWEIFQAMRPIFTDIGQDISRSIGYYSNLHRDAKLERLIGMGGLYRASERPAPKLGGRVDVIAVAVDYKSAEAAAVHGKRNISDPAERKQCFRPSHRREWTRTKPHPN